jgi:hypothetical protein
MGVGEVFVRSLSGRAVKNEAKGRLGQWGAATTMKQARSICVLNG